MAERLNRVPGYVCCVSVKRQVSGDRTPGAGPGGGCGQESESPSARLRAPPPRARPAPRVLYVSPLTVHKQPVSEDDARPRRHAHRDQSLSRVRQSQSEILGERTLKCVLQRARGRGAGRAAAGGSALTHSRCTLAPRRTARQERNPKYHLFACSFVDALDATRSIPISHIYEKNTLYITFNCQTRSTSHYTKRYL